MNKIYNTKSIPKEKIFLIPRDNRLLIEIIKDEIGYLKVDLMNYKCGHDYIEDNCGVIDIHTAEIIELDIFILRNVIDKIKNPSTLGLSFLSKLTKHELDSLCGAIEQKIVSFDFQEIVNKIEIDKISREEVTKLNNKIMPYLLNASYTPEMNMFED